MVGSGTMTVLVGHLMCTLDEPCTAHLTHSINKKSGFLFKCILQVGSALPFLPPACDTLSTPGLVPLPDGTTYPCPQQDFDVAELSSRVDR